MRQHLKLATLQYSNREHSTAADHLIQAAAACKALPQAKADAGRKEEQKASCRQREMGSKISRLIQSTNEI